VVTAEVAAVVDEMGRRGPEPGEGAQADRGREEEESQDGARLDEEDVKVGAPESARPPKNHAATMAASTASNVHFDVKVTAA